MGSKNCKKIVGIVKRHRRIVRLLGIAPEFIFFGKFGNADLL